MSTGRRKEAIAKVQLKVGSGQILVNGRLFNDYFPRPALQAVVRKPLAITQTDKRLDCVATVRGGGIAGQAGALQHGLARALLLVDGSFKGPLRKSGLLTRDFRSKERKKYGQKGARKRFQWTKR